MIIQVFQLTTLVLRGPATRGERFAISLDRVAIPDRDVLVCAQIFARILHFIKRITFADSITLGSVHAPWSNVKTTCAGQVVSDLRPCWYRAILRWSTANDTSEGWYHGGNPRSEISSGPRARIALYSRSSVKLSRKFEIASPPVLPQK